MQKSKLTFLQFSLAHTHTQQRRLPGLQAAVLERLESLLNADSCTTVLIIVLLVCIRARRNCKNCTLNFLAGFLYSHTQAALAHLEATGRFTDTRKGVAGRQNMHGFIGESAYGCEIDYALVKERRRRCSPGEYATSRQNARRNPRQDLQRDNCRKK